jgi:hypothetical protein
MMVMFHSEQIGRFSLPELKQYFTHFLRLSREICLPVVKIIHGSFIRQGLTAEKIFFCL